MSKTSVCMIEQHAFDRWYIVHSKNGGLAWSGSQWVSHNGGIPTGGVQVCNFDNEEQAMRYVEQNAARIMEANAENV